MIELGFVRLTSGTYSLWLLASEILGVNVSVLMVKYEYIYANKDIILFLLIIDNL
jgi:hypothetical protein